MLYRKPQYTPSLERIFSKFGGENLFVHSFPLSAAVFSALRFLLFANMIQSDASAVWLTVDCELTL
jgi:hypothetical protein